MTQAMPDDLWRDFPKVWPHMLRHLCGYYL
jgi:hypothetical protein